MFKNKDRVMKKSTFILLFVVPVCAQAKDSGDATGKTFYSVRPQYQSAMPVKESLFYDRAFAATCGWSVAIELVPFYSRTTKSKDLAKYFMYRGKTELLADNTQNYSGEENLSRDIDVRHFNIRYQGKLFRSLIQFRPRQTVAGLGITWRQYLHAKDACEKNWWLELSGPIYHVKNEMHLQEKQQDLPDQTNLGPDSNVNMTEGFKGGTANFDIKFGKINGARKKTGFADLEIKLGYDVVCEDSYHADFWLGILVPTGNKPKAEYMFEPIIGHNKHWGIIGGAHYGVELWSACDSSLNWEVAFAGKYFFKNDETRMFDLKFRPWSRYMLVIPEDNAFTREDLKNGSEFFTGKMQVTPRFQGNINSAFVYTGCNIQAEVGYNFWACQAEKVRLDKAWQEGPAILDIYSGGGGSKINLLSNIGNDNSGAGVLYSAETRIKESDLDLASAAHPAAQSHTVYGALGYRWDEWCWPTFVGFGGSYEFSAVNTAVNRWTVWGKLGVSL
jgi:hypothetical protein